MPALITVAWIIVLAALVILGSVASYLRLLMRRLTPVGERKLFVPGEESRIRADRERVGVSISTLHGVAMHLFAVGLTALLIYKHPDHFWTNLGTAVAVVLCVIAICDQLIPFMLVARHDAPEAILREWMPFLRRSVVLAVPLTFPILISTTIARLLESPEGENEESTPQQELQDLIQTGEKEGLIEKGERELIQSVVEFGDKVVREVMTPRPEIAAIEISSSLEDLRELFRNKRYTRFPVYTEKLDNIEGILSVRDLFELSLEEQAKLKLKSLVRPVRFTPETKPIKELLKELQESTTQMAIVVDEYGSVSGLVTLEDLLEEIVGEIRDEVEPHDRDIVAESSNTYVVAGHTDLGKIADQLHVTLEGRDFSTVAGLVMAELGHVPVPGERAEKNGLAFEVLEANPRTVLKVRVRVIPAAPQAAPSHAGPSAN
jgi:putative hemolysin